MSVLEKFWRTLRRTDPERNGGGLDWHRLTSWAFVLRLVPLLALTGLHLFLFPPIRSTKTHQFVVGDITEQEIRAPFSFRAPRPRRDLEAARLDATQRVVPVYVYEAATSRRSLEQLGQLSDLLIELAAADSLPVSDRVAQVQQDYRGLDGVHLSFLLEDDDLQRVLDRMNESARELLTAGIVDITPHGTYSRIGVLDSETDQESERVVDSVVLAYRLDEAVDEELRGRLKRRDEVEAAASILGYLLAANLVYDDARTEERRGQALAGVPEDREYARNERIIDGGMRVNREHLQVLEALELARQAKELEQDTTISVRLRAGRLILVLSLLMGMWFMLGGRHHSVVDDYRQFLLVVVLLALFLGLSAFVLKQPGLGVVALPIVLLTMLSTILFGEGPAARISAVGTLLIALIPSYATTMVVAWAVVSVLTIRSVRRVRTRNQFYKAILSLTLAYVVVVGALTMGDAEGAGAWFKTLLIGVGSGVTCTALSLFLLPVFESLFEVTTDLTLLELSDLNHPLLMRMSLESPGTYHHSQVVGTLAEAASREIGANSLKTRVGSNYHDIGKLLKPRYYVENQKGGPNAHDELSPHMSALVIAAHVKDGVELGRQWGLPKVVTDFIPEHHGTSVMRYFYHKALERDDGTAVKVDDFRYPGPKPQSKETAIAMLADGVEAGTRSLRRPTTSRIREMTRSIMQRRMDEGELDECGLTMRDLAKIREAFIPILVGIHHQRVAYPGQKEHEDQKEKESVEARSRGRRNADSVATRN